jgi:hypothetical protein
LGIWTLAEGIRAGGSVDKPDINMADPVQLFLRALKGWKTAFPILMIGLVITILILHLMPRKYTVSVTITSVSDSGGLKLGSLSSLSNLAGIALPGENGGDFDLFLNQIASDAIAEQLIRRRQSVIQMIFWREWNTTTNSWQPPSDNLKWIKNPVKAIFGIPSRSWQAPDAARVTSFLEKNVKIKRNKKDPIAQLVIETDKPKMAVAVLDTLRVELDSMLRQRRNNRTQTYVDYLTKKIPTVTLSQQRDALYSILSDQEKLLMVSSSNLPFAAENFGAPYISSKPTYPRIPLVLGLGLIISSVIAIFITLFIDQRKKWLRAY